MVSQVIRITFHSSTDRIQSRPTKYPKPSAATQRSKKRTATASNSPTTTAGQAAQR